MSQTVHVESAKALEDVVEGLSDWPMWGRLGWQEVRRRYRRTTIGPFWNTLSLGIFIGGMGLVWATIWKQPLETYLPFVTTGFLAWNFVSILILEGCTVFQSGGGLFKELKVSFTTFVATLIWRNVIIFVHNLTIFVCVALLFPVKVGWETLLCIPGVFLVCLNAAWMALITGLACVRYRDLPPLIGSLIQVAMFLTPIFYMPEQLGAFRTALATFNPLFHLIDVIRAPLLGNAPDTESWIFLIVMAAAGWALALGVFMRFRRRIVYWL